jgi:hypothetical protein
MAASIAEAKRSADAMVGVSDSLKINAQQIIESVKISKGIADRQEKFGVMQYRPYISIHVGNAHFQDTPNGIFFDVIPRLVNTGATPAKDVRFRAWAAVLPMPLPTEIKLGLPATFGGKNLIAPHNDATITVVVKQTFPTDEVQEIMFRQKNRALYAWGVVTYRDSFKNLYRTTFLHQVYWTTRPDGRGGSDLGVAGTYLPRHNRMT